MARESHAGRTALDCSRLETLRSFDGATNSSEMTVQVRDVCVIKLECALSKRTHSHLAPTGTSTRLSNGELSSSPAELARRPTSPG